MVDGHFDYGNGYHGRVYLNPHQLFRHPSTIWRVRAGSARRHPGELIQQVEVVAGPVTGGALLAHTMAGLLDSRRSLTHPPSLFAPFNYDPADGFTLRDFYRTELAGKRVLLADDVRNTGETLARCAALVTAAGATVVATVEICDRMEVARRARRSERGADRVPGARELQGRRVPALQSGRADHQILIVKRPADCCSSPQGSAASTFSLPVGS